MNTELAYKVFADHASLLANLHEWEMFVLTVEMFESGCSFSHFFTLGSKQFQSGVGVSIQDNILVNNAAIFLRDNLLKTTGERAWGLEFVLQKNGKFNITYDYNTPEWVNT